MKLEQYLIDPEISVASAIEQLNDRATQILLVVDSERRLEGTVTDGDIRRALLAQADLSQPVRTIMKADPLTASPDWSPQQAESLMHAKRIHHLPVVAAGQTVVGIFTEESLVRRETLPNSAVLMAGGLGTRLGSMTEKCPKPMLRIGGKPILETAVEILRDAGIRRFTLSVNYLSEQIEDYFGDGDRHGVTINYLRESEPLGTAGALRKFSDHDEIPFLVMNGDILTRVNFAHLLDYHRDSDAVATMCVQRFDQQIPFGVIEVEGNEITDIQEKPTARFFVNSGIYVLDPLALEFLPDSGSFDMPQLFSVLRDQRKTTIAYPIQEYWVDVGEPSDFQQAESEYHENFKAH